MNSCLTIRQRIGRWPMATTAVIGVAYQRTAGLEFASASSHDVTTSRLAFFSLSATCIIRGFVEGHQPQKVVSVLLWSLDYVLALLGALVLR